MDTILAVAERSGLVEEYHAGAVAVVDASGDVVAAAGDVDRSFFSRSAAKPFQAYAALGTGLELPATHLAVACASHSGDPVHVAIVEDILARFGLDESDLRCPPDRPFERPDRRLAETGDVAPARRYHNCSGKHAAMLAACVVAGWDISSYPDADHPLQQEVARVMADVVGDDVGPPGVDGCGLPVWRVTVRGLARAFSRLENDPRFWTVRDVMSRYPMLVSGEGRADGLIGRWTGGIAKAGAAGCMGASVGGFGIAAKAWSGSGAVAGMGVGLGLGWLGVLSPAITRGLAGVTAPPVLGGGEPVGRFHAQPVLESM